MTGWLAGPVAEATLDGAAVARAARVNAARRSLLTSGDCATLEQIAQASGALLGSVTTRLRRRRERHAAIAVDHDGRLLVPTFQLDDAFTFRADVASVILRLRDAGLSEWAVWDWFTVQNVWLESSPTEAIQAGEWDAIHRAVDGLLQ